MHVTDEEKLRFWAEQAHKLIDQAEAALADRTLYDSVYLERVDRLSAAMGHLVLAVGTIAKKEVPKGARVRKSSK